MDVRMDVWRTSLSYDLKFIQEVNMCRKLPFKVIALAACGQIYHYTFSSDFHVKYRVIIALYNLLSSAS